MKALSIIGLILLAISGGLFYVETDFLLVNITMSHLMGIMGGIGIGLFLGGIVGYISKGNAVKREKEKQRIAQLQNDKYELQQKVYQQEHNITSSEEVK